MFTLEEVIGFLTLAHTDALSRRFHFDGSIMPADGLGYQPKGTHEFVYRHFGFSMTLTVKPSDSGTGTRYTMQWKRVSEQGFSGFNDGSGEIRKANAAFYKNELWYYPPVT